MAIVNDVGFHNEVYVALLWSFVRSGASVDVFVHTQATWNIESVISDWYAPSCRATNKCGKTERFRVKATERECEGGGGVKGWRHHKRGRSRGGCVLRIAGNTGANILTARSTLKVTMGTFRPGQNRGAAGGSYSRAARRNGLWRCRLADYYLNEACPTFRLVRTSSVCNHSNMCMSSIPTRMAFCMVFGAQYSQALCGLGSD